MLTKEQISAMSPDQLQAYVLALQANTKQGNKGLKVSEKGGISVYGLSKWPVTLYVGQWNSLFARIDEIKAFIDANASNPLVKLTKDAK